MQSENKRIKINALGDHDFQRLIEDIANIANIYGGTSHLNSKISGALHAALRPHVDEDLRRAERTNGECLPSSDHQKVLLSARLNCPNKVEAPPICFSADKVLSAHGIKLDANSSSYRLLREGLFNLSVRFSGRLNEEIRQSKDI
jgi:hypothetical protein